MEELRDQASIAYKISTRKDCCRASNEEYIKEMLKAVYESGYNDDYYVLKYKAITEKAKATMLEEFIELANKIDSEHPEIAKQYKEKQTKQRETKEARKEIDDKLNEVNWYLNVINNDYPELFNVIADSIINLIPKALTRNILFGKPEREGEVTNLFMANILDGLLKVGYNKNHKEENN